MANNEYTVEYARTGRSSCKDTKCKKKIADGSVRIGKISDSPFGDDKQTTWYHPKCIWNYFGRAKGSTKKIESTDDVQGFDDLKASDQASLQKLIDSGGKSAGGGSKKGGTKRKTPASKSSEKGKKKKKKTEDEDEDEDEDEAEDEAEDEDEDEDESGGDKGGDVAYLEHDTKFWEVRVSGKKAHLRWGKIGNEGQSDVKSFPTAEKAQNFAEKKQREKERKGYSVANGGGGGGKKKKSTTKGKKAKPAKKASKKSSSKKGGGGGGGGTTYLTADSSGGGKFWEITVSGKKITTRWGKEGSDGQSKSQTFASDEKAENAADKQIRAKKRKGYS